MNAEPVPFPLTDLPPDLQFNRLYASEEWDLTFSYEVKRLALGPQVAAQWGSWDHAFQWPFHLQRFAERCFYKIVWQGRSVGTVALTEDNGHVRFEEFYILPEVHRNGIG